MKKIITMATIIAMTTTVLVGCGGSDEEILDPNKDTNIPMNDKIDDALDKDMNDMFDNNYQGYDGSKMYQDGLYKAELSEFDGGYKDYVELTIKDNKIVDVIFDGKNETGQFKTKDDDLKNKYQSDYDTYPEHYATKYAEDLIDNQSVDMIADIPGAEDQSEVFIKLVNAALMNAQKGDTKVAIVDNTSKMS